MRTLIKSLFAALILMVVSESKAQYVAIPDTNFGTWLNTNGYSTCLTGNNTTGWYMDTSCTAVVNATSVDCSNQGIRDLTGIQYFDHLQMLSCYANNLTGLPRLPSTVTSLNCFINQLTTLPTLPAGLQVLNCDNNQLTGLPALPDSLHYLSFYNNQVTTLSSLPPYLQYLICTQNQLASLPVSLPSTLTTLECDSNHLTVLPALPSSLSILYCQKNQLSALPSLPGTLTYLICNNNQLTALPALPPFLISLVCAANQISVLGPLPAGLQALDCGTNQISGLTTLPSSLTDLACNNNLIASLPALPGGLTYLDCHHNLLNTLPLLPTGLNVLDCSNNQNLTCLPNIRNTMNVLYFDSTSISCMPNRFQANSYRPANPYTYPLCTGSCVGQAGPDQTVFAGTPVQMAAVGTGAWTALTNNPPSGFLYNSSSPVTNIYGLDSVGVYHFVWNSGAFRDTMSVTVRPNAGSDKHACRNSVVRMDADGNATWYALPSNPGPSLISDTTYPYADISGFNMPGVYYYTWRHGSDQDTMTITADTINISVSISVWPDTIVARGDSVVLTANVNTSAPIGISYRWSPAIVLSNYYTRSASYFSFFNSGFCVLATLATGCSASACQNISAVYNSAGSDQTICKGASVTMAATGTGTWSALSSNPAAATINNSTSPTTTISGFTASGTYSFVWNTAAVGDTMDVTVNPTPDAGPDQTITLSDTVTMAATGIGTWSALSTNPVTTTIANTSSPVTTITGFTAIGNYSFVWANGGCDDTMNVVVNPMGCGISANQHTGCAGTFVLNIQDTTSGIGTANTTWYVTLPDGSYDTIRNNFQCAPPLAGQYGRTIIRMTNTYGCNVTDSNFYIYQRPTLRGGFSGTTIASGQCVSWVDSSLGNCGSLHYLIDWGGGPLDTLPNHCHMYVNNGNYSPSVVITNSCGCITDSTFTGQINVIPATFSAGPDQIRCMRHLAFSPDTVRMASSGTGTWSTLSNNTHSNTIIDSPSSPTTLIYANPFMPGLYGFVWTTGLGADTMYVTLDSVDLVFGVNVGQPAVCSGSRDSFSVNTFAGVTSLSYVWYLNSIAVGTGLSYVDPALNIGDSIWVVATSALGCVNYHLGSLRFSPSFIVSHCYPDSVWPGDANRDGIANNVDLLNIGLAYDSTGPVRPAASPVWVAQYCTDWADTFVTGVNYKFADCDGNGHVTAADTVPLMLNFGLTHAKTNGQHPYRTGQPLIYPILNSDTVTNGDTMLISIHLGQVILNATNVYGIAFDLNYDPAVIDTTQTVMNFPTSWLGSATDQISIYKDLKSAGIIKAGITRIDHTARSGQGQIAYVRAIVTTDNIDGKDLHYYKFRCSISNVTMVDVNGDKILTNEDADSNQVAFTPLAVDAVSSLSAMLSLYPNPAMDAVIIASSHTPILGADVLNMLGEKVRSYQFSDYKSSRNLDVQGLGSGVYYVSVKTAVGSAIKKLIINH